MKLPKTTNQFNTTGGQQHRRNELQQNDVGEMGQLKWRKWIHHAILTVFGRKTSQDTFRTTSKNTLDLSHKKSNTQKIPSHSLDEKQLEITCELDPLLGNREVLILMTQLKHSVYLPMSS